MVQTYQVIAVLSGDIIGSTELTAAEIGRIRDVIRETVARFEYDWGDVVIGTPEFFSGDAWQLAMTAPQYALRLSVLIRAELRARLDADTRISIGIGHVEDVRQDDIALSSGEAFILSGRALSKMTGYFDLTTHLPERVGPLSDWVLATTHICSAFLRNWTRRQAEISGLALLHKDATHEDIGGLLTPNVRKQTVTDSLRGANWRAVQEALIVFEETDWHTLITDKTAV
ncbi:hypothetical protein [Ponticaulis profundi]|uniref:Guanylate cyclase domain-containing protein n=1 Tax=Ponticaulis profundi TaxID=2665222 RepID=A0ABW1S476_9PROT